MMGQLPFGQRLREGVRRVASPLMVGLDPRWESLPPALRIEGAVSPVQKAARYSEFCRAVIDVVASYVAVVKPQSAFFEACGPAGSQALAEVCQHASAAGLLVVIDAKRNDIGSTATAYAEAYLGKHSAYGGDALTVSPYLGEDSLEPFVTRCETEAAGLFVLVKTSNPGGGFLQDLPAPAGRVYDQMAALVERLARKSLGAAGEQPALPPASYGSIGAVVGATYPEQLEQLRQAMPHAWILVPGFGAQGATARDVAGAFAEDGLGAVVNSSRGIIFAYQRDLYAGETDWQRAVERATQDAVAELRDETPAGRLAP